LSPKTTGGAGSERARMRRLRRLGQGPPCDSGRLFQSFLVFFRLSSSSHFTGAISPLVLHHLLPVHMPSILDPSASQTRMATRGIGLTLSNCARTLSIIQTALSGWKDRLIARAVNPQNARGESRSLCYRWHASAGMSLGERFGNGGVGAVLIACAAYEKDCRLQDCLRRACRRGREIYSRLHRPRLGTFGPGLLLSRSPLSDGC
jgi:hypothetical protein